MSALADLLRRVRAKSPLVPRSTRDRLRDDFEDLSRRHHQDLFDRFGAESPFLTFAPPGHFYSALPPMGEARAHARAVFGDVPTSLPGIDGRIEEQLGFAAELAGLHADFSPPAHHEPPGRYYRENPAYGIGDARVLQAVLRHLRPKRVIEVGSGHSSALTLDVVEHHLGGDVDVTFIEPYPELLRSVLRDDDHDRVEIVVEAVQDVDLDRFDELEAGDVAFFDTTHVVRPGSDVNRDVFDVLPRLRPGVAVHFHDVFYPFEYPESWIIEGRAWTETYLLRAFLAYNRAFEIMLFPHQLAVLAGDRLREVWPASAEGTGASLWLRRVA